MSKSSRKCAMCGVTFHIYADQFLVCGMCGSFHGRRQVHKDDNTIPDCPRKRGVSYKACSEKCKYHNGSIILEIVRNNGTSKRKSGKRVVAVMCGKMGG